MSSQGAGLCHSETVARRIDLLALQRSRPDRYPYLLESAARHPRQGRYDILFACPEVRISVPTDGQPDFLAELDRHWRANRVPRMAAPELPFRGGWFVYLGYELADQIEPRLGLQRPDGMPVAFATRIPAAVIRDHQTGEVRLMAEPGREDCLDLLRADLAQQDPAPVLPPPYPLADALTEAPPEVHLDAVGAVRRYIHAGDVFQVNLSRAWHATARPGIDSFGLYASLRARNPAPFAAHVLAEGWSLLSSSPERLVRVSGDQADTRPIAGTRPRGVDAEEDRARLAELTAHPKERAEHVMLIDLERNDLGRVCRPGSIHVNELMTVETYAHVHHIVSNVRGRLRADVTPGEVLRAVFPGGTITGCPKVRCMEILRDLERTPRGAYTGSVGYLNRDGDMDFNILIRSMTLRDNRIVFRAGGGIVADSVPEQELAETRAKAKGLVKALDDRDEQAAPVDREFR